MASPNVHVVNPRNSAHQSETLKNVEALAAKNNEASHPKLRTYAVIGAKADVAFILYAAELGALGQMHRDLENCFPAEST